MLRSSPFLFEQYPGELMPSTLEQHFWNIIGHKMILAIWRERCALQEVRPKKYHIRLAYRALLPEGQPIGPTAWGDTLEHLVPAKPEATQIEIFEHHWPGSPLNSPLVVDAIAPAALNSHR